MDDDTENDAIFSGPVPPTCLVYQQPTRVAMDIEPRAADQAASQPARLKVILIQVLVAFIANLAAIGPGMSLGFSAIALPQMKSNSSVPQIDEDEASWIASLAAIATPFGCILSGPLLDKFGRKLSLLALNVPCVVGWILLATAPHSPGMVPQAYVGRILTGLATGLGSIPAPVYVGETSDQSLRGMLVTWTSIAISLGILMVYILGSFLQHDWRLVAGICAIFPILAALLAFFVLPESPTWLITRGRVKDAEVSMRRLRGVGKREETPEHVQEEIDNLTAHVTRQNNINRRDVGKNNKLRLLLQPETLKPLLIMNAFFFFQQFSGTFVIIFYAVDIVSEAGVTLDKYLTTILIGVTRVIVTIVISYASKFYGRRPLSIISGSGMTLCMGSLATYLCLFNKGIVSEEMHMNMNWLPVTALLLYILMSTVGFLTLPFAMIGEVFPAKVRGLASGMTTCMAYIFSFIIVKFYPDMLHALESHGVFYFYAAVAFIGTVFVVLFLPETQGKSLQEIEEYFSRRKPKKTMEVNGNVEPETELSVSDKNKQPATRLIITDI